MPDHAKLDKQQHRKASVPVKERTVRRRRPSQGQSTSARAGGSAAARRSKTSQTNRASQAKATAATGKKAKSARLGATSASRASKQGAGGIEAVREFVFGSRAVLIAIVVIVVIVGALILDSALNFGRAYGNVSVEGVDVGGQTADEMRETLQSTLGRQIASTAVTVLAGEKVNDASVSSATQRTTQTEQVSVEEATKNIGSWNTDGAHLAAALPYDEIIADAMEAGRKGGPIGRLVVMVAGENVDAHVVCDESALEDFASTIDKTIGDPRVDASVEIDDGVAHPIEGHDGVMVDRAWLESKLSDAFLGKGETSFTAEATPAPSRITPEQAQEMANGINAAITPGVVFNFKGSSWTADANELGKWTKVDVVPAGDGFNLNASIDDSVATSSLVKNVSAQAKSLNTGEVTVEFEASTSGVSVHTSGAGNIPEVVPAIDQLEGILYGSNGLAYTGGGSAPSIDIGESNAPETLSFDQAIELGIITLIGEYTTEFANDEGTENRNHNIKLVADLLNNSICKANGGTWSFNEHSGDTNQDPPFSSAGSIVNGEYVDSIGGGICQVATTIFNAVFEAGLDVVQRQNHSLYIASYPEGRDVGVSYPELDFVWGNNLQSDVLLKMSTTDTTVTAQLYGVYTGYTVESKVGEWEHGETYKTEVQEDPDLEKGDIELKTVGEDGRSISVTRTVKDKDGNVIAENDFDSVYEAKNEVYIVGPGTDASGVLEDAQSAAEERESEEESEDGESSESSESSEDDESLDSAEEYSDAGEDYAEEESYDEEL